MKKETCLKYGGFSSKYKIISDFDLFFKISLNCKISCINKPLTYLIHDDNTSEKYLYFRVNDMDKWINFNKYSFENKKLFKYCENIQERNNYLRIKLYITQNKKFKSFRNIFLIKSNLLKIKIMGHLIKKNFYMKKINKTINLFTYDYPYEGNDNPFIEDEIQNISKIFNKVNVIPFKRGTEIRRTFLTHQMFILILN